MTSAMHDTLIEMLDSQARTRPGALALVATRFGRGEVRRSYEELRRDARRLADGLRQLGIAPGTHIGIMLDNFAGYEACVSMLAIHRLGGVVVPINARFSPRELAFVVRKAGCAVLIAQDGFGAVDAAYPDLRDVRHIVRVDATNDPGSWNGLFASGDAAANAWPAIEGDRVAEILFTSGTTAHPKGAVMTHARCAAAGREFAFELGLRFDDVYQSFFPIYTTAAIHCVLFAAWSVGCAAVLDAELHIGDIRARADRERSTVYIGAPSFYAFLLDALSAGGDGDLSSIRLFNYGGAAMAPDLVRRLAEVFPQVELRQTYGSTESGGPATFLEGQSTWRKLGSVGRPSPHTEIRIVDEDGATMPALGVGEIALRNPSMMREYHDEPALTAATLRDGWLLMGDVGYLDEEGYLFLVDRKKDLIIRGGHNISSVEVEAIVAGHGAIQDVAVVGVDHEKLGEDIVAFIVLRPGACWSAEDVRSYCGDKLADYKIPRIFHVVETLPRGPMGKTLKTELRRQARERLPR